MNEQENNIELMEDIEVVGPGEMLRDAREKIGLSQEDVAVRLNFRVALVNDIENETFDKSIAETFNRGYLRNYAKLVNVADDDILASYESLNIAALQCAEMQSFSRETVKQAENAILMWVSYLIAILLLSATVVWWIQSPDANPESDGLTSTPVSIHTASKNPPPVIKIVNNLERKAQQASKPAEPVSEPTTSPMKTLEPVAEVLENTEQSDKPEVLVDIANAEFTFLGDCWVNIYDATGERIAWGVKRTGYVMNISGVAPFSVTLGKPELVQIVYADQAVSTASFARGNIAKFLLPLPSEE